MKPRPSPIVTAVSTIRSNLSNSSVPLIAELMKNSRDSSWFLLTSSFSTFFFSDMSLDMQLIPMTSPDTLLIGEMVRLTVMIVPSFLFLNVSILFSTSPLLIL